MTATDDDQGPSPVPFTDLGAAARELGPRLEMAVRRVVESGKFVLGAECAAFEERWAAYLGVDHAVGVGSGADALYFALRAVGVGPGHEVIVPAHTFVATWISVTRTGALPVPVEPDPVTMNIDPDQVEEAVSERTRAIVPVHLYGASADMPSLLRIGRRHGIALVEDAAQAHGARVQGDRVGTHGDATAWSFYPAKNLGALGDGGAVTTRDPEIAACVRALRNHGRQSRNVHTIDGTSSRLDEVQAAALTVKLDVLDEWNERRRAVARRYLTALADTPLRLPSVSDDGESAWHLFVVGTSERNALRRWLAEHGVETGVHYPTPPHRQPLYAGLHQAEDLPITDALAAEVLSLPMGPHLTDDDVMRVARVTAEFFSSR